MVISVRLGLYLQALVSVVLLLSSIVPGVCEVPTTTHYLYSSQWSKVKVKVLELKHFVFDLLSYIITKYPVQNRY